MWLMESLQRPPRSVPSDGLAIAATSMAFNLRKLCTKSGRNNFALGTRSCRMRTQDVATNVAINASASRIEKDEARDSGNARKVVGADLTVPAFTPATAISSVPSPNLGRDRDDAWVRAIIIARADTGDGVLGVLRPTLTTGRRTQRRQPKAAAN